MNATAYLTVLISFTISPGIRVQFEAVLRVAEETNTSERSSVNFKYFYTLIPGSFKAKENLFCYTPIAAQINGILDGNLLKHS